MHAAGRIGQVDVMVTLVVAPSRNVRTSQICVRRYIAIDIITRQKRNIQLRLLSSEKELIQYINYRLMEKVFQLIEKSILIAQVLRAEGKIGCITYDLFRHNIQQIEEELRKYSFTEGPDEKSFSNVEKYVNEHINYADTDSLIIELGRRSFFVKKIEEEEV